MTAQPAPGSPEWLRIRAWFACEYCSESGETTVHRDNDLRCWNGLTICDDCFSGRMDLDLPDTWTDLDPFEPFRFLDEEKTA
jgi:hypothetical protein